MTTSSKCLVLITGANQGVGFETAKNLLLHSSSYHILLGSRDLAKGSAAAETLRSSEGIKGTVEPIQIDVTDDASVDAAAEKVGREHGHLDILVNNAGTFSLETPARDALRKVLAVNVVGVVSVTEAFLPLLLKKKSSTAEGRRIVFVGSSVGSTSHARDPSSKYHNPAATEYRCSKAALNMLLVQYWARLTPEGFKVLGADPGLNATNFTGSADQLRARGAVEPHVGGERVAMVVRGERDADLGRMHGEYGVSPW